MTVGVPERDAACSFVEGLLQSLLLKVELLVVSSDDIVIEYPLQYEIHKKDIYGKKNSVSFASIVVVEWFLVVSRWWGCSDSA